MNVNITNLNFVDIGILQVSEIAAINIKNCTAIGSTRTSTIELSVGVGVCVTVRQCIFKDNNGYAIRHMYKYIHNRLGNVVIIVYTPTTTLIVEDSYFENTRGIQVHNSEPEDNCHEWECRNILNLVVARSEFERSKCHAISVKGVKMNMLDMFDLVERATIYKSMFRNTQRTCPEGTAVVGDMMQFFSIRSSLFSNNTGREGGAVRFNNIADPSISTTMFLNNRASVGGAVSITSNIMSPKLGVTVIDSSTFINNKGSGLGQSLYNNEDILLRNVYIEADETTSGYHLHSECGTFEMNNLTINITRSNTSLFEEQEDGGKSNGLFVASNQIEISNGWKYTCPTYLNSGVYMLRP